MDDPVAWVRAVAYRIKVSAWRSAVRRIAAYRRHGPPDNVPDHSPDSVALIAALRRIPEAQRRAIVLFHIAGLTIDQVAAEVGAPAGTVKARLSRGRAALAVLLAEPASENRTVSPLKALGAGSHGRLAGRRPGPGATSGAGGTPRRWPWSRWRFWRSPGRSA